MRLPLKQLDAGTAQTALTIPAPVAPYAVAGGVLVYSGGVTYQGISTTLTEGAKPSFITETAAGGTFTWGASGVTLSTSSTLNSMILAMSIPAVARFYVRLRMNWSAVVNWCQADIKLTGAASKYVTAASLYYGGYVGQIAENGDTTFIGGAQNAWWCMIYNRATRVVQIGMDSTTAADADPGSPFEGVNWSISGTTKTVAQADAEQEPWVLQLRMLTGAAGTGTVLFRAPASGLLTYF